TPDVAPKAMIEMYGDQNGFGWQLNKPLGTQILSIPTNEVLQKANTSLAIVMSIVTVIFAFAICMTNYWVKRYVVRPIKHVVNVAEAVSTGNMEAEFDNKFGGKVSKDEIGNLVEAFTRMKISLVMAIRALEKYRFNTNRDKNSF
ncbi:MAG: HAMP domain-containing protein, partial [Cyanobacteria bacterium J06639_18]